MVKEGYKETEIGVIPENWDLLSAKNLMKIETGSRNTEHKSDNGKYLFFVRSQQIEHINSYHYDCEAVLTAGDGVGTGKVFHYVNGKFDAHQRVYVMSQFKDISGRFFYNYFKENFGNEVSKYTAKSSVDSVRRDMIAEMLIPVPSFEEQQKIAEALSNMDSLISSLEKLIEKKKAIKRGAIHELITAKKSLSGFKSEKVSVKLSDIAIIKDGTHGTYNRVDNGVYLLSAKNIFNNHMEVTDNESMISFEDYSSIVSNGFPKENDILLSCVGTIGRCCIYTGTPRAAFQRSVAFVRSKNVDVRYLLCLLQSEAIQKQLKESSNASAQGGVYLGALENLNIEIFADINEQKAIANILFDMDIEITALEQKLTKCKKLKQGMMQQLLTGKIRLTSDVNTAINENKSETVKVPSNGHNHQFDDAVVIAGIVDKFYSDRFYLGRKKVQKLLYLFRRHQEADTSAFKKKAAGPYAGEVRYKGGEPIAKHRKYVSVKKSQQGSLFSKGENISEALKYISDWGLNDDFEWLLAQFKYIKTDKLELLTTIDMAMCDLANAGEPITVDSIRNLIQSHSEWKAKLTKNYFRDNDIAWAITECKKLFN